MARRLFGIAEIAQEIDADRYTVAQWFRRGKLPRPDARLAMGPVWTAQSIRPWITRYRKEKKAHGTHPGS